MAHGTTRTLRLFSSLHQQGIVANAMSDEGVGGRLQRMEEHKYERNRKST
jgi:hypothetical protein